jgi:threonine dehydrogenase-like Zn-dependent dehydrogenase
MVGNATGRLCRMRALSVVPGQPDTATVEERPDPPESEGAVLVDGLLMGVCGTDVEIAKDGYGIPPAGQTRMVLGHESLGRVRQGAGDFVAGDLVAGVVRRPDGCAACADDQWDMCLDGGFVERGIKGADGYGATSWRADPRFLVKLDPELGDLGVLLEPTSVVAKAWEQVDRIGSRAYWAPKTALVTGAGPIGLLAALLGVQRGLEVTVVDLATEGAKPQLVQDLGATYSTKKVSQLGLRPDVVIECTGVGELVYECLEHTGPNAIVALAGISAARAEVETPLSELNKELVLSNEVVFGTVNAGKRHYAQAADAMAKADRSWLERLVTKRVPLDRWADALSKGDDDVKVVIDLQA